MLSSPDVNALIEAIKRHQPSEGGFVSLKNINILVMGAVAAAGALVWNTVTSKTPETFSVIQQQTAEIRTTVIEMRSSLTEIKGQLDNNTRTTSEQQAKITGLESTVKSNSDRLQRLEDEARGRTR